MEKKWCRRPETLTGYRKHISTIADEEINRGVLFGNLSVSTFNLRIVLEMHENEFFCSKYDGLPYVGIYNFISPYLLVRDAELVKNVLNKDFSKFHDNNFMANEQDPVLSKNPFSLRGQQCKVVRSLLTPSFTSGKVTNLLLLGLTNYLFDFIVSDNLIVFFLVIGKNGDSIIERFIYKNGEIQANSHAVFEAKELSAKYTTENIAVCAFGMNGKCFDEPNAEFREIERKIFKLSFITGILRLAAFIFPFAIKTFNLTYVIRITYNFLGAHFVLL